MTTTFPIMIDSSCAGHPLLRPQYAALALPAWAGVTLSPKKLFGYAAMKLQDAAFPDVATYDTVRRKANSMIDLYGRRLTYQPAGMSVAGDTETKATLSELVGIGVGLAAACKVFQVNPNRISRFISSRTGKRMDYEFVVRNRRYLHEVRGTTSVGTKGTMVADVAPKKAAPASQGYAAHSGVVTLYSQGGNNDYAVVLDPPAEGGQVGERDELAVLLEYYHNVYRLTHTAPAFLERIQSWLARHHAGERQPPPRRPSANEILRPRVTTESREWGAIGGTIYDARILPEAVRAYETFDSASEAISQPTWLVGTLAPLDGIIRAGDWEGLLEYEADFGTQNRERDAVALPSGFVVMSVRLTEEEERAVRTEFERARRRMSRSR